MNNEVETMMIELPALGAKIVTRARPVYDDGQHQLVRRALATVDAVQALDEAVGRAAAMVPPLAPMELRAKVHEPRATVELRVAALRKLIAAERDVIAETEDFLRHPAPAEAVAELLVDHDLRAYYRLADDGLRGQLWQAMAAGTEAPLLEALARLPVESDPTAVRARQVFEAQQREAHPAKVTTIRDAEERATWAATIADQITATLDRASMALGPSLVAA